jgi:hypothetical protein
MPTPTPPLETGAPSPSTNPPETPSVAPAPHYGVVVSGLFGPSLGSATYNITLVAADGHKVATAAARRAPLGPVPSLPTVSASASKVYYLDGPSQVKSLTPSGATANVIDLAVASNQRAAFAVSPDDRQIAVAILEDADVPYRVRLYVQDLAGGARREILTTTTRVMWPVGWRSGQLVMALGRNFSDVGDHYFVNETYANCPECGYFPTEYLVLNATDGTPIRSLCVGEAFSVTDPPVDLGSNLTSAGVLCLRNSAAGAVSSVVLGWDGRERLAPNVPINCAGPRALLSPDGELIATGTFGLDSVYGCARPIVELKLIDRNGASVRRTDVKGRPAGWIDERHLAFRNAGPPEELEVLDVITGLITPVDAQGTFVLTLGASLESAVPTTTATTSLGPVARVEKCVQSPSGSVSAIVWLNQPELPSTLVDVRPPADVSSRCPLPRTDGVQLVSRNDVSYLLATPTSDRLNLVRRDLLGGSDVLVATLPRFYTDYDWSADGRKLAYLTRGKTESCPCPGNSVHLQTNGVDRVVATFGNTAADTRRVIEFFEVRVRFSPSGERFVVIDAVSGGPGSETLKVFDADGKVLFSTVGDHPVWAGEVLVFHDASGIRRWEPGATGGTPILPGVSWTEAAASTGGARIAFVRRDPGRRMQPAVILYDMKSGTSRTLSGIRSGPVFLTDTVLWWQEETLNGPEVGLQFGPSSRWFAYDVSTGVETPLPSVFAVFGVWPR